MLNRINLIDMENVMLDKIKKLLNKADGAKELGSMAEADAFLAKVQELLLEHNLSMDQVRLHDVTKKGDNDIVDSGYNDGVKVGSRVSDGDWEVNLINAIAQNFSCHILYREHVEYVPMEGRKANGKIWKRAYETTIIGRADNIVVTKYVFGYVRDQIREIALKTHVDEVDRHKRSSSYIVSKSIGKDDVFQDYLDIVCNGGFRYNGVYITVDDLVLSKKLMKEVNDDSMNVWTIKSPEKFHLMSYREPFLRSFFKGAVHGVAITIARRMLRMKKEATAEAGLILYDENRIELFVKEKYPDIKDAKSRKESTGDKFAYERGVITGNAINIAAGGIDSTTQPKLEEEMR